MGWLLGNLIGLGRLMRFVATEVGIEVGELTVVSHHAVADNAKGKRPAVKKLNADCRAIVDKRLQLRAA
jgi:hypothetical protein